MCVCVCVMGVCMYIIVSTLKNIFTSTSAIPNLKRQTALMLAHNGPSLLVSFTYDYYIRNV